MRIVPFWRTSLSDPHTKSPQYYFDHFEIHPIKVSIYIVCITENIYMKFMSSSKAFSHSLHDFEDHC